MIETKIDKAKVFITARFKSKGSVLRETIEAVRLGIETRGNLASAEPADRASVVIRNAQKSCYVMQTILKPTPIRRQFTLNGEAFEPEPFRYKK
jgi:hypothetical protein